MSLITASSCCSLTCSPYLFHPFLKGWSCGVTIDIQTNWTDIHLNGSYYDPACNVNCPDYVTSTAPSCGYVTVDHANTAIYCPEGCHTMTQSFNNITDNHGQADDWHYGICATPASSYGSHGLQNLEFCDATWGSPEACAGCEVGACDSLICNDGGLAPPQQSNPEASCLCTDTVVVSQYNVHNKQCLEKNCGDEFSVCDCENYEEGLNPIGKYAQHGLIVDKWGGSENEYAEVLTYYAPQYTTNNPVVQDALVIEPHDDQPAGCVLDCRLILHFQEVLWASDQFPIPNTNPVQYVVPDIILYPSIYAYFYIARLCQFGNGSGSAECMYVPDRTVASVCLFDGFRSDPPPSCGTEQILMTEAPSYWAELKIQITVPAHGAIPASVYDFAWRGYGTPVHIHEWIAYYCVDDLGNPLIKDQRTTGTPPSGHWMGLRVPESCLNRITGKYTQMTADGADADGLALVGSKYLCDSIQVNSYIKPCTEFDRIEIPDNSDFFRATEVTETRYSWSGQYRYGYGFRMCVSNYNRIGGIAQMTSLPCNNQIGLLPCPAGGNSICGASDNCGGHIVYTGQCAFDQGNCPDQIDYIPTSGNPSDCSCNPSGCIRTEEYFYTRSSYISECQAGYILDAPLYWSRYNEDIDDGIERNWEGNPAIESGCASSAGCPFSYCTSNIAPHCAPHCNGQQGGAYPTWEISS